jgi:N-sulfoglucosamine sulfohydrolase
MRPNILYLHSHDTGRHTQPYGAPVETPGIQRLAAEGLLFRQAFCAAPTCSPSRAALLTGQAPHTAGMLGLAHRGFALHDYQQHLLHTLRPHGYSTALFGVQHIARDPAAIGYDHAWTESTLVEKVAPAAAEYIHGVREPFYLEVGFFETHRDFPDPGAGPHYCDVPPTLPDAPATRQDMAAFYAAARELDRGVGAVLRALDEAGLAENTLVILTTDHGIAFPGAKCTLTDHGIGVALIMRGPGGFAAGRVSEALVSQIDLFPTICELLEIERPAWLQGKSLMPLVHEAAQEVNDAIFAEVTYHAAYEPQRAVRTRRYKYIRRYDGRGKPVLPNIDDGLSKSLLLDHGLANRAVPDEALYDLMFDPQEARNVAGDPRLFPVLQDMRARLERWMQSTGDPLLHGPVPLPPGAVANDPDGSSPTEPPTITGE